jgi:hypothetical protein
MNEREKTQLRASLIKAIEDWWESESEDISMPWVGSNSLAHAADAALAVIFALQDTQEYLEQEHGLKS